MWFQRPANDNTKEKCRKFLANLLELSSREPKSVERSVRTLIQELIDMRVEPEDFCDRLERLLNASPQPCLIGFLKVSSNFGVFVWFVLKEYRTAQIVSLPKIFSYRIWREIFLIRWVKIWLCKCFQCVFFQLLNVTIK